MEVIKRNGIKESVDRRKISRSVERACRDLEEVSPGELTEEAFSQLFDGISTTDIDRALVLAARSRIAREPNYSYAAARLLLNPLYKEAFGHGVDHRKLGPDYRRCFVDNLRLLVGEGRIDRRLVSFDLDRLSQALDPEKDFLFKYLGLQTLYDRYFLHVNGRHLETPQAFWMRVAMGLSVLEDKKEEKALDFYELFSTFRYCPSTPTLFNSGTTRPQLSSCYLSTVHDSIDGIFGTIHDQARLSKYAGGLGVDWTNVRALNAHIKGTNGKSQGVIPWLKVFNDTLVSTNQGGKRKGSGCAYLEVWHLDVFDFIDLRKNTGDERRRCHDMNTAVWIPDLFMERVRDDKIWTLFSPDECPDLHETYGAKFVALYENYEKDSFVKNKREVRAKDLWKKILISLLETGHPWITFKDPSNYRHNNKHVGPIHHSNLCTEIVLHTKPSLWSEGILIDPGETAVCNLGSINLSRFVGLEGISWKELGESVRLAIRALDNVIDVNFYPTEGARVANLKNRPVGLGVMGWADALYVLGVKIDSDEAVRLAGKVQEFVSFHAIVASALLAKERRVYPNYQGSLWSQLQLPENTYRSLMTIRGQEVQHDRADVDWDEARSAVSKYGMRNSHVQAIAPTATISFILGCSQSIEPDYSVLYVYSTLSGEFTMFNEHFVREVKSLGLWSTKLVNELVAADGDVSSLNLPDGIKEKYRKVFLLDMKKLIEAAGARQKWIDMGQSLNLYSSNKSLKHLSDLYFHAWGQGLKTTYYLRTLAASKVEKSVQACRLDDPTCEACQ